MKPPDRKDKFVVVVGTVTNDLRLLNIPKLKVLHNYLSDEHYFDYGMHDVRLSLQI